MDIPKSIAYTHNRGAPFSKLSLIFVMILSVYWKCIKPHILKDEASFAKDDIVHRSACRDRRSLWHLINKVTSSA